MRIRCQSQISLNLAIYKANDSCIYIPSYLFLMSEPIKYIALLSICMFSRSQSKCPAVCYRVRPHSFILQMFFWSPSLQCPRAVSNRMIKPAFVELVW